MLELLKKLNTAITVVTTAYAVTKFMIKTFKKYEEKHGKVKEENSRGNLPGEKE
jgi:hypothetical protein